MPTQEALVLHHDGNKTKVLETITNLTKDNVSRLFRRAERLGITISIALRRRAIEG